MEGFHERPVWLVLLYIILSAGVGVVLGTGIGALLGSIIYQGEGDFFQAMQTLPGENLNTPMLVMQGVTSLFGFLVFPFLTLKSQRRNSANYFNSQPFLILSIPLVLGLILSFTVADSAVIEWNQNIHFPDFLKSFENWARAKEDELAMVTKMFTQFHSVGEFITAFIVVGVVAGICEEFLFRGIIQNEFYKGTNNIHVAIWTSAFLFSLIHMQFFGFVPRMLLGALFGYLYYWSGNLLVPMFAHFVNNGFSVLMLYLNQKGVVDMDMESTEAAPWPLVIIFTLIGGAMLYYFKNFFDKKENSPMANKKFSNLVPRLITGILGSAGIIFGVVYSEWLYFAVFFIIVLFSLLEFYKLSGIDGLIPQKTFGVVCGLTIYCLSFFIEQGRLSAKYYFLFFPLVSCLFIIKLYKQFERKPFTNIAITFLGIFYTAVPFALLNIAVFEKKVYNYQIILGSLLILWATDTGAYFAGTLFGKRKLFERISPKKSWEGFAGGAILAMVFAYGASVYFTSLAQWQWLIIGWIIIIGGTYGDLVESLLKRSIEIKDSGDSLPGHGGFLDRFDGLFISAPFIVAFLEVF